jgi:transposase-like protein
LDDYLYWQERLAGRGASGLSIDEFCLDEGVSRSTFYRWIRRIQEGIPESVKEEGEAPTLADLAAPKFLPVTLTASPVEIELPNGGSVRVVGGFSRSV